MIADTDAYADRDIDIDVDLAVERDFGVETGIDVDSNMNVHEDVDRNESTSTNAYCKCIHLSLYARIYQRHNGRFLKPYHLKSPASLMF